MERDGNENDEGEDYEILSCFFEHAFINREYINLISIFNSERKYTFFYSSNCLGGYRIQVLY